MFSILDVVSASPLLSMVEQYMQCSNQRTTDWTNPANRPPRPRVFVSSAIANSHLFICSGHVILGTSSEGNHRQISFPCFRARHRSRRSMLDKSWISGLLPEPTCTTCTSILQSSALPWRMTGLLGVPNQSTLREVEAEIGWTCCADPSMGSEFLDQALLFVSVRPVSGMSPPFGSPNRDMHRLRLRHVRVSVVNRPGCILSGTRQATTGRLTLYPVQGPEEGARARGVPTHSHHPTANRQPPAGSARRRQGARRPCPSPPLPYPSRKQWTLDGILGAGRPTKNSVALATGTGTDLLSPF
jgi:hypothetical protein